MCFNNQISETNDCKSVNTYGRSVIRFVFTDSILSILIINVKWERPQEVERSSGGF